MSKIDWSGELEAYHEDGRVGTVEPHGMPERPRMRYAGKAGIAPQYYVGGWDEDGFPLDKSNPWRIRNRQPPTPDRLTRLEAFVARVADSGPGDRDNYLYEAKALVAELNPVDRDTLTARNLAALVTEIAREEAGLVNMWSRDYSSGDADEGHVIAAIVEALRQARKEGPTP